MRVLMFSTDRKIFEEESDVRHRMLEYGAFVEELHVVIFSRKKEVQAKKQIGDNIWIYSTHSRNKLLYVLDAFRIGKKVIYSSNFRVSRQEKIFHNALITSQNPFETAIPAFFLSRKFGIPFQLQVHTDFLNPFFKKESFLNRMRVFIARFLIPRANCIRVVSERIKDSFRQSGLQLRARPFLLPIFVDIEKIEKKSEVRDISKEHPQFDFLILVVSRLSKEKNISCILRAFRRVHALHPKAGLIIVGEGPERQRLQKEVIDLGIGPNVSFEGWQGEDRIAYFKSADVFVASSRYEGYGMTFIEAAASRCPIVTTDVGLIGEVLRKDRDVLIYSQDDEDYLARLLFTLRGDENMRQKLTENAYKSLFLLPYDKEEYLKKYKLSWKQCLVKN